MRLTLLAPALALSLLVLSVACSSNLFTPNLSSGDPIPLVRLRAEPYSFTYYSGLDTSTRLVVRDAEAWAGIWAEIWRGHSPTPPLPQVDFARDMLIVAGLGTRPSGGYSIFVDRASAQPGSIDVVIRTEAPGNNCAVAGALAQPVDIARLPRSSESVRFHEQSLVRDCR